MKITYSVENYPQVASETAKQLGAVWKDTYYHFPQELGKGMIEAYELKDSSAMIAIFDLKNDLTVQRVTSTEEPKLLIDVIFSGFSPLHFKKDREVNQLGFNIYLSTNRVDVSAKLPAKIQHEQICIEMNGHYVKKHLPKRFLQMMEKEFFKPIKIPSTLDSLISSLLISQNEDSRLKMIPDNLTLLLTLLVDVLKEEESSLTD